MLFLFCAATSQEYFDTIRTRLATVTVRIHELNEQHNVATLMKMQGTLKDTVSDERFQAIQTLINEYSNLEQEQTRLSDVLEGLKSRMHTTDTLPSLITEFSQKAKSSVTTTLVSAFLTRAFALPIADEFSDIFTQCKAQFESDSKQLHKITQILVANKINEIKLTAENGSSLGALKFIQRLCTMKAEEPKYRTINMTMIPGSGPFGAFRIDSIS